MQSYTCICLYGQNKPVRNNALAPYSTDSVTAPFDAWAQRRSQLQRPEVGDAVSAGATYGSTTLIETTAKQPACKAATEYIDRPTTHKDMDQPVLAPAPYTGCAVHYTAVISFHHFLSHPWPFYSACAVTMVIFDTLIVHITYWQSQPQTVVATTRQRQHSLQRRESNATQLDSCVASAVCIGITHHLINATII